MTTFNANTIANLREGMFFRRVVADGKLSNAVKMKSLADGSFTEEQIADGQPDSIFGITNVDVREGDPRPGTDAQRRPRPGTYYSYERKTLSDDGKTPLKHTGTRIDTIDSRQGHVWYMNARLVGWPGDVEAFLQSQFFSTAEIDDLMNTNYIDVNNYGDIYEPGFEALLKELSLAPENRSDEVDPELSVAQILLLGIRGNLSISPATALVAGNEYKKKSLRIANDDIPTRPSRSNLYTILVTRWRNNEFPRKVRAKAGGTRARAATKPVQKVKYFIITEPDVKLIVKQLDEGIVNKPSEVVSESDLAGQYGVTTVKFLVNTSKPGTAEKRQMRPLPIAGNLQTVDATYDFLTNSKLQLYKTLEVPYNSGTPEAFKQLREQLKKDFDLRG